MNLPKIAEEPKHFNPSNFILIAQEKAGKTTFASQLPGALLIDLENGSNYVTAIKVKANNTKELDEIIAAIEADKEGYPYIVLDTITKLEEMCVPKATMTYMKTPIGQKFNRDKRTGKVLPIDKWESVPC